MKERAYEHRHERNSISQSQGHTPHTLFRAKSSQDTAASSVKEIIIALQYFAAGACIISIHHVTGNFAVARKISRFLVHSCPIFHYLYPATYITGGSTAGCRLCAGLQMRGLRAAPFSSRLSVCLQSPLSISPRKVTGNDTRCVARPGGDMPWSWRLENPLVQQSGFVERHYPRSISNRKWKAWW